MALEQLHGKIVLLKAAVLAILKRMVNYMTFPTVNITFR